jgi:DNA gyrase/topoisomerase IV subunit A
LKARDFDTTEMMLISQFGKIIRIDTPVKIRPIRSAGRSTSGVKLLNLDTDDKVAAAVVIPPKTQKSSRRMERSCSSFNTRYYDFNVFTHNKLARPAKRCCKNYRLCLQHPLLQFDPCHSNWPS